MKQNPAQIFAICLVLLSFSVLVAAQKTVVPIVFFDDGDNPADSTIEHGNLLGGVGNGKWLNAKTTFGKLKGTEKYSLFNFESGKKGEYLLGEIKADSVTCFDSYYFKPQLKVTANFALGANADWEVFPRQPKKVSFTDATYKKSVKDVLRLRGLPKSPAKIIQAFRVDLDGDGREEVILEADYTAEDSNQFPTVGTYSFIIIRKTVGGKAKNLFVDGYFMTKKDAEPGGDPSISGIADLNGDGKMEIVVKVGGYEENWLKVYEMKAGKPSEIEALSYYCGV
ncbi:MAG: VCBS repeat-containing protein [Actinomycetota bacterium]